jgi:chitodextrinase
MKKLLSVLFVILTFFAYGTDYYVGGTGASDTNPGTSSQPFATIQKAANVAIAGDVIKIRSGTYRETIVPLNSGTTYQPDLGATVIISGLNEAGNTGWTVHTDNIYKKTITLPVNGYNASITSNTTLLANQVFKDDAMMFEARWPKINGLDDLLDKTKLRPITSMVSFGPTSLTDNGLPTFPGGLTGGKLIINGWFITHTRNINSHNGNTIAYAALDSPQYRKFYYVTGKLGLLTQAKEWHYESGTLYFWQEGGGMPTGVEYKARNWGFDLRDKSNITIAGLRFFGCEPVTTTTASINIIVDGIRAKHMNHSICSLNDNDNANHNASQTGTKLIGPNSIIRNSELEYAGSQGIWIGENGRVENNLIHDISYEGNYASGITPWTMTGNQVMTRNTIYRCGRTCIDFGGPTESDRHLNMDVSYNHLYFYNMLNVDGGAIYSWWLCDLTGTRLHHNWIHDSKADKSDPTGLDGIQTGIYFDQASGPLTIDHNVLWNNSESDYYGEIENGERNTGGHKIYNNTFASGTQQYSYVTYDTGAADVQRNNIYRKHIVIAWGAAPGDITNSLLMNVDPMFIGTGGDGLNYRIQSGSPAIDQGIVLPGITEGSIGTPDIGAYEFGGEAWVPGYLSQNEPPIPPGATKLEAEAGILAGGTAINTNHAGYSGTGFVDGFGTVNASVTFSVNAASAGSQDVTLRYANANTASNLSVYVNNVKIEQIGLPSTNSWSTWADKTTTLILNAGVNSIRYKYDAGDIASVNLDYITVSGDVIAPSAPTNLASPSKTDTSVNLTWTASTDNVGVTGYDIYNGTTLLTSIAPAISHNVTGLIPNTAYVFTVKAKDAANNLSAASNILNVTTDEASTGTKYEAEVGTLAGGASINTNHAGYSGTGFVDGFGTANASVTFSVNVGSAGSRDVTLRYANANTASTLSVYVNNVKTEQIGLPTTNSWSTWGNKTTTLILNAGINSIRYKYDAGDIASVNLDYIIVGSSDVIVPSAPTNLASPSKTDTSVNLTWTASTDNVGVTGYDIYNGATLLTSISPATSYNVTGLTSNTAYVFTLKAKDAANNISAASAPLNITTSILPTPWLSQDIGNVGLAGSASYSGGVFTINGSGTDIWNTSDEFHFVHRSLNGDGEIIARVSSIENTHSAAKAGVMIRETLTGGSKHALVNRTPQPQHQFMWRSNTNGTTNYVLGGTTPVPNWVKLKRLGNVFSAFESNNGTTWTQVGSSQTITMAANVYIGLAVLAHDNTTLNTSIFDNVMLNDGNGSPLGRVAFSSPLSEEEVFPELPSETRTTLFQNSPNSFSDETEIKVYLTESTKTATLIIYDLSGKVMKNFEMDKRGAISIYIGGNELKSGVYLYSLIVDGKSVDTKRMILTK